MITYVPKVLTHQNSLDRLFDSRGRTRQLLKLAEEMTEFTSIYLKVVAHGEELPIELVERLVSEYFDVLITMTQFERILRLKELLPKDKIDEIFYKQIERLQLAANANRSQLEKLP